MEDRTIIDHVVDILRSNQSPLLARQITQHLAERGIQIERQALNQILWNPSRNVRHQEMRVDGSFFWTYVESAVPRPDPRSVERSLHADALSLWELLDFQFLGVQRKGEGHWFFFLGEEDSRCKLIGPTGTVLRESKSICSEPEDCEPSVFTPQQIAKATEELLKTRHSEVLSRNRRMFQLARDTEFLYEEAYRGACAERVVDHIPLDAAIVIAPVLRQLDKALNIGLAALFRPVYLVIDLAGLGLEDDKRYGVFRLSFYELLKKGYVAEANGGLQFTLMYHLGKVYLKGSSGDYTLE